MNTYTFYKICFATIFMAAPILCLHSQSEGEDEVFELSPFAVSADDSEGYRATSTLAGSRLRTPLRDVGSAIEVVTKEFLEDTGATSGAELLSYTMNSETGGVQGNFAGGGSDSTGNRTDQNQARINPQSNQRVRGLGAATLTRDFFQTDIPFDTYNSSQITINRGPNSILFGVGGAGGIIDNSLNKASVLSNFGNAAVRFGSNRSYRNSVDINRVLIEDRLAVRISGLLEKTNYRQKPAYEQDNRLYASVEAVLLKNEDSNFLDRTVLRANFENGTIESNPPMVIPPRTLYHNWWSPSDINYTQYTGGSIPANHTTDFESQYTVSLDKTPAGINQTRIHTLAYASVFDQGALIFQDPDDQIPDAGTASFPDAQGLQGRLTFYPGAQRYEWFTTQGAEDQSYAIGFVLPTIQDRGVFDYRNQLFSGNTSLVERDFTTLNLALEQLFFENQNLGIELAFDSQEWKPSWRTPIDDSLISVFSNSDISIDVSEKLGNGDPNPNLGRPLVRIYNFGGYNDQRVDRRSMRATGFYELDFEKTLDSKWGKWLGSHTFTGLLNTQRATTELRNYRAFWGSNEIDMDAQGWSGPNSSFFRAVNGVVYVGPSVLNANGPDDVRISPIDISVPDSGDVYNIWYQGRTGNASVDDSVKSNNFLVDHVVNNGNLTRNEIDSQAITIQSRFLDGHIVALAGWRKDEAISYERLTTAQILERTGTSSRSLADGNLKPENFILQNSASSVEEGDTFTGSIVAHVPDSWISSIPMAPRLSFHYGQSENFAPAGLRRDVYLNVLSPPSGETKEYGFSVELGAKVHARFNWFKTEAVGAGAGLDASLITNRTDYRLRRMIAEPQNTGWTFEETKAAMLVDLEIDPIPDINTYAELETAIVGMLPSEVRVPLDYRVTQDTLGNYQVESEGFAGQVATAAVKAEGFELDIVANPTPYWRFMLKIGKQETTQSDSAVQAKKLADAIVANLVSSGLSDLRVSPTFNAPETVYQEYNRLALVPLNSILARDGSTSLEQRKWRANVVTNYQFGEGSKLRGIAIGGAVRWQDEAGIGYGQLYTPETGILPDLSNPFFAPSQWNGDVWFSYGRQLTDQIDWKIQLNIRNAIGDDEDIPVRANPDGSIAVIRIPNERSWFLTNNFSF